MNIEEVRKFRNIIISHIEKRRIADAIFQLFALIDATGLSKFKDELEEIERSYKYMIQYMMQGVNDPLRNDVYNRILLSLYSITDKVVNEFSLTGSPKSYYGVLRYERLQNISLHNLVTSYNDAIDKVTLYKLVADEDKDISQLLLLSTEVEKIEGYLFKKIWTTFPSTPSDIATIEDILNNDNYSLVFKELTVSALFLNLLEYFDENKIAILIKSYFTKNSTIQLKALCALLIILYKYQKRVESSKIIQNHISLLFDGENFKQDIINIFIQYIRSQDTERITRKMQDELLPELMKMSPEIYKKIKDSDSASDSEDFEGNPMWQDMLDKTGITKKMQELNEIQMEGGDVFMGTFAHLKNFPFFFDISNWFIPYHANHSINIQAFGKDNSLNDVISKAPFLCNSDKYSFALSVLSVPENQRKMMISQIKSQNIDMSEMQNSELTTATQEREGIINCYMQDLYRFFKLFNRKGEFYDPFSASMNMLKIPFIGEMLNDLDTLHLIGEFYFKQKNYKNALEFFLAITQEFEPTGEVFQKIGFCYQNLNEINKALEYYSKAEFLNANDFWTLKNIASCHRMLKNIDKALEYYKRAEIISPNNLNNILTIGHTLLENDNIEEALKYYYKVAYLNDKSTKAIRPIAWCEYLMDNYDQSRLYYDKILQNNPTSQDYINIGHLSLACGNIGESIKYYKSSVAKDNNDINNFLATFEADKKYIIKKGINIKDIPLILDMVRYDNNI